MKNLAKNILWVVVAFFLITSVFSLLTQSFKKPESISLSQLVGLINDGSVKKISVSQNDLEVELASGEVRHAKKEAEASLTQTLANFNVDQKKFETVTLEVKEPSGFTFWLITLLPFILPVILIALFFWLMFRQVQRGSSQPFTFVKSLARIATFKEKVTFKDVAGLQEAKEELGEIVEFLRNPKKFLDLGAKIPRGVLLVGSPGTGKTLLARAVAGEANVPFFHMSGSEFVEMFVGVGASRVRDLFTTAKRHAPSIIFIDEIDAVGRHRGAGLGGGHDEREQTLNQILVELDGFDRDTNIIIMAATNRPDILDPALLRPGRFDRRAILDLPDIKDREAILRIHSKGKPIAKDVNFRKIAERTPGFSGADLANIINEAAILAAREGKKEVNQLHLINSIEKVLLGPERKSHILSEREKKIAAYHEAGHALVAASLPHADPVHKVSIVSRGRAAGYTLKLPTEDKHLRSFSEFVADLAVALGGYATEKIVFNELTTGASNDLEQATELARRLVTRYGMSSKLGPRTYGESHELVFLGKEIAEQRNYSENVAYQIDQEVNKLIKSSYNVAVNIIKKYRKKLDKIASVLMKQEVIEQEQFNQLMA
ncbi:ATP-dependent metallopeptidase FtsH/Yme1/Tma family protein [Candidatus Parcubacteria bacterium]|nr:MAG: ATP-dependent metallopeptidase FtsH/Yme1/Tma family protein [Candidatus Parcubacteria bacterium]